MVRFFNEIKEPKILELGGKGYSLIGLMKNGFNIPKGFMITSETFFKFLKKNNFLDIIKRLISEINENNYQEKSKEIRNLILKGKMPKEIISEIKNALKKLNGQFVSIRSSAVSEDSLKASFAGLHDTFLNVKMKLTPVLENVKRCWASLFNERGLIYRIKKKIPHFEGIAVIVQEMISAEISGITFTKHPTDEKSLLVEASYGLGDIIVGGRVEPDDYIIDRKTLEIKEKKIGKKEKMSITINGNTKIIETEKELAKGQVLPDNKIKEIAKVCLKIEKIFNYPQDIEWCIADNKLWILQSRAITSRR
jgi:pyruvate,water dikinase